MEEEKKVLEVEEETFEEEIPEQLPLPAKVETPVKKFKLWKTKEEKLEEEKLATQREIAKASLKLVTLNDPEDQAAAAELKKMNSEDFWNGVVKVGKAIVKGVTVVTLTGGTVLGVKALTGKKSNSPIDTTFEEVSNTETPEE